jgi:hypothetical protein
MIGVRASCSAPIATPTGLVGVFFAKNPKLSVDWELSSAPTLNKSNTGSDARVSHFAFSPLHWCHPKGASLYSGNLFELPVFFVLHFGWWLAVLTLIPVLQS